MFFSMGYCSGAEDISVAHWAHSGEQPHVQEGEAEHGQGTVQSKQGRACFSVG